jgi:single-strand DNA-binding protein
VVNVVLLQGVVSSAVDRRELANGSTVWSFDVATKADGERAETVPVSWSDPPATVDLGVGMAVLVLGRVRRRFFRTGAGTQSRTEVVVHRTVIGGDRRKHAKLLAEATARFRSEAAPRG